MLKSTQVLLGSALVATSIAQLHAQSVYSLSVTPIAAYDSRWNGSSFDAVGTNAYSRDVNGAPIMGSIWEAAYDTIWSQAGVDISFETEQHLDLNDYTGSATNPLNILNFQSTTEENYYFFQTSGGNADLETDLAGFASTTGSANTHHVMFTNSYSNATPRNTNSPPDDPMDGGLTGLSASGTAVRPSPGAVTNMRSLMAIGDGVVAFETNPGINNPSSLPTVLAHELGHNLSLPHLNFELTSEHYDPTRSDALLWSGGGSGGSQNVINAGEVADALRTAEANGVLALEAGETGTFWDTNGVTAGYGGSGTWNGSANNFGRPSGSGASGAWTGDEVAVFRASGSYNVTVEGTQTATGIAVQQGDPTFGGAGSIDLTNGTADVDGVPEIFVESGQTATVDAVITGGGGEALTKIGAGTLVLNGTNTYNGGVQVRKGELEGDTDSIVGAVELVNGSNGSISTVLHFNQSTNDTFTSGITGDGDEVRKTGAGTLTLSSASLSYAGVTNVNAGRLDVDGTKSGTGAVNVASGASLGGTGSIAGATTVNGNLDLRDTASGTVSFTTSLAFDSAATSFFEIDAGGVVDHVNVSGLLTMDGQIELSDLGATFSAGNSFDLFDWGSVNMSGFSTSTDLDPFLPGLSATLAWDTSSFTTDGTISIVTIPEPGSVALLAFTFGLAFLRRRR